VPRRQRQFPALLFGKQTAMKTCHLEFAGCLNHVFPPSVVWKYDFPSSDQPNFVQQFHEDQSLKQTPFISTMVNDLDLLQRVLPREKGKGCIDSGFCLHHGKRCIAATRRSAAAGSIAKTDASEKARLIPMQGVNMFASIGI